MGKNCPKIGFFLFWKILPSIFAGNVNKNCSCLEFDIAGRNLGLETRYCIFATELFVIINSFMITQRNENQWIYQWIYDIHVIWKLSFVNLLRSFVFELFEHGTMLIVFLFLVLILSIWLTIKPDHLGQFYSLITEKYDQTYIFAEGVWCIFLKIYSVEFLNFFHEDNLSYILKIDKARFSKLYLLCR